MKLIVLTAAFFAGAFVVTEASAGTLLPPPATGSPSDNDDTSFFLGLNWTFGAKSTVEGVAGVVHSSVDSDGDVEGARASVHFDLQDLSTPPNARLTGILGDEDIAAEAGLGIGFDGSPFVVLGAIGNYYNLGGTLGFDGTWGGYVGAHSYGDFDDKPNARNQRPNPTPETVD